ncbi:hypothetical protein D3C86_1858520 [compost metagenome]
MDILGWQGMLFEQLDLSNRPAGLLATAGPLELLLRRNWLILNKVTYKNSNYRKLCYAGSFFLAYVCGDVSQRRTCRPHLPEPYPSLYGRTDSFPDGPCNAAFYAKNVQRHQNKRLYL